MVAEVNLLAVLLAAVSSMAVGYIWYGDAGFGKQWQKMTGLKPKDMEKGAPQAMAFAFVSSLLLAFGLSVAANYYMTVENSTNSLAATLMVALFIWVFFQATRIVMHDMFEQRRKKLSALNIGSELVTILLMATIIGLLT